MSSSDIAAEARDRELSTSLQHSVQSLSDWLARFGECSSQALGPHALRPLQPVSLCQWRALFAGKSCSAGSPCAMHDSEKPCMALSGLAGLTADSHSCAGVSAEGTTAAKLSEVSARLSRRAFSLVPSICSGRTCSPKAAACPEQCVVPLQARAPAHQR